VFLYFIFTLLKTIELSPRLGTFAC